MTLLAETRRSSCSRGESGRDCSLLAMADLAVKIRELPLKAGLDRTTTTWLKRREDVGGQDTARDTTDVARGATVVARIRLEVTEDLGEAYVSVSTCHQRREKIKNKIQILKHKLYLNNS